MIKNIRLVINTNPVSCCYRTTLLHVLIKYQKTLHIPYDFPSQVMHLSFDVLKLISSRAP